MRNIVSSHSIFLSLDNILPLNDVLYLPNVIFTPLAGEASSNKGPF